MTTPNSNSIKRTLEERITEKIRDESLLAILGDEDAITEMVRRSVHEALFSEIPAQSRNEKPRPSPLVATAGELAKKLCDSHLTPMFDKMLEDPEIKQVIVNTMIRLLPEVIYNSMFEKFNQSLETTKVLATNDIRSILMEKGLI